MQDEISTGLDSSTTFQIVRSLKDLVQLGSATALIALLQPAPEVFVRLFLLCIILGISRDQPCCIIGPFVPNMLTEQQPYSMYCWSLCVLLVAS